MGLEGKVAVVTGASRGIGRSISLGLAAAGAKVVVASRTEVDDSARSPFEQYASGSILATAEAIAKRGGTAEAVRCDITLEADIRYLIDTTLAFYGRIDVLVSNAGIDCEAPVVDLNADLLDECLAVNVRAPLLLCKYALPTMIAQKTGSIFGITSGSALGYRLGRVGYSMSKAGLDRMMLSLAEEVRSKNIAVNLLDPGRMDTWMNRRGDWPGTSHIPMEQPDTIIPSAVWLARQTAATFTGQRVNRSEFGSTWGTS